MLKRQTSSSLVLEDLQKVNEELRKKLSDSLLKDSSLESSSVIIQKLCEKETEELRLTVSRLERLLALEREERNANDEKAIELLSDVKRQWQEREEARINMMRAEVESAMAASHETSRRNAKLLIELERSTSELENALDLKNKLKEKCQELKAKLENLKKSFKEKNIALQESESAILKLEAQNETLEGDLQQAKKDLSDKESISNYEKDGLRQEIKEKEKQISELQSQILDLQEQIEDDKVQIREGASKLQTALADLKEAQFQLSEVQGTEANLMSKNERLKSQIEDLETQLLEQSRRHDEELLAMEENRREDEQREVEKYTELQGEVERLLLEKQETSFSADESERKAKSMENEIKKIKLEHDELCEKYKRKKLEFENKIRGLKEESEESIARKEDIISDMKEDLKSIQSELSAIENDKDRLEKELARKEDAYLSQAEEVESLKRQLQELESRPPPSPVKVINNIVVDNSAELETERKALEQEKKSLETQKSDVLSKKEEMNRMKGKLDEETKNFKAKCEKESLKMKSLRSELKEKEERLTTWSEELKKEREVLTEDKSRIMELKKDIELTQVDLDTQKESRERELSSKSKQLNEAFSKERLALNEKINQLSREKEGLEKEMKAREKKETQKSEKELDKSQKELSLIKVDLRIANKQVNEHKETISYLRQMYRDERDSARKMEEELNEIKIREEQLKSETENLKKAVSNSKEDKETLVKLKDELSQKTSEAKNLGFQLSSAKFDSERLTSRLEKAEKDVIKYRESQTQLNIYKAACLELENQTKEFETVIEKLEEQKEKLATQLSESKSQSQAQESNGTQLKIEINDLKSKLIFANSQLKESNAKINEMETIYKTEESKLRDRLNELSLSKEEHLTTINGLKTQMEDLLTKCSHLTGEDSSKSVALKDLKESYSTLLTRYHELSGKNDSLISKNEDLRIRLARTEDKLQDSKDEMGKVNSTHQKLQHELMTKINQLEKLIDYLQTKLNKRVKCKGVFCHQKYSDKENVNVALPYEALKDKLKEEENKNKQLTKELNSVRGELRSTRTKDNATTIVLPTPNDQRANHSIPHRWTTQTNMKVTKCSTCFGDVHFCRQASVCQYCHRTVHTQCVSKSPDDCGLPKTLAPVLKNSSGKKEKPFEGYLKIPEQGGKYWMSVHVKILDDKLIIKGEGMDTKVIDLMPSNGFVYIQSSVVYTELLHTTAYDQPHVFKIGYSNSKDTHYFMAKSFTDKAMWIKEIENISLRMKIDDKVYDSDSDESDENDEGSVSRSELAALDPSYNVYCVAPMKDSWLLGTSSGFLFVHSGIVTPVERSPSTVYQMEIVPSINKIVLITGHDRKLGMLNMDRIHSRDFNPINLTAVKSCHLFGVGSVEKDVYLCAVDDCRVSIFKYEGESFRMVHKFSTDSPTSCLQFTSSSVLVITDKIYDIDLEDFAVEEFLDLDESPMTLSNNYPIAMYQINNNEFLLCFQERGLFVNSSGNKSRPDIKWNSISGQFAYSRGKLWVTYYNAVEVFDLSIKEQPSQRSSSKMMLAKNPQILSGQGHVYLLEERNRDLVLLELTKND